MGLGLKRKFRNWKEKHFLWRIKWLLPSIKMMFCPVKNIDYKKIPVIINNFNRLTMLKRLVGSLETRGYRNIIIVDNNSTYPPLLEWYHKCPYRVILLNENVGHLSIWKTGIAKAFSHSYFAYTDSDLEIVAECPDDFMEKFVSLLKRYPTALKAGFSLKIDDLPDSFDKKSDVVAHESQFWDKEIDKGIYDAPIDTTFAVYKPFWKGGELVDLRCRYIRTGSPYTARHLPWYISSDNMTEEEKYYLTHINTLTHWSCQEKSLVE